MTSHRQFWTTSVEANLFPHSRRMWGPGKHKTAVLHSYQVKKYHCSRTKQAGAQQSWGRTVPGERNNQTGTIKPSGTHDAAVCNHTASTCSPQPAGMVSGQRRERKPMQTHSKPGSPQGPPLPKPLANWLPWLTALLQTSRWRTQRSPAVGVP